MKTRPSVGDVVIYNDSTWWVRWMDGDTAHLTPITEHSPNNSDRTDVEVKISELEPA